MSTRSLLTGALALLALVSPAPPGPPRPAAQEDKPAAAGALSGLERALTRHGSYAANGLIRRLDARDFRGCKVTYDLTPQVPPGHAGYVPHTERTTVDLTALDIERVQVRTGRRGASVSFAARSGVRGIERRLGDGPHSFGEASALSSALLFVPSKLAAEEVRAALVRAIESCGSKDAGAHAPPISAYIRPATNLL